MKKTFEHLLGLTAMDALAILKSSGIFDVRVTLTHAPVRPFTPKQAVCPPEPDEPREADKQPAAAFQFFVSEEKQPYDPLLEPVMDDKMLIEARVIGVRDDGRQLLVSHFRVSPKEDVETTEA